MLMVIALSTFVPSGSTTYGGGSGDAAAIACERGMARNALTPEEQQAFVEVDTGRLAQVDPTGRHYVDVDTELMPDPYLYSIWFYDEANGIPGLQRGDEAVDQTCGGRLMDSDVLTFF